MLKTYRIIPFTFILFLVFGFSFIALQVTTEHAEAGEDVCIPNDRIQRMKDTPRHKDYMLWVQRCKISHANGNCGIKSVPWPAGDSGRCAHCGSRTRLVGDERCNEYGR